MDAADISKLRAYSMYVHHMSAQAEEDGFLCIYWHNIWFHACMHATHQKYERTSRGRELPSGWCVSWLCCVTLLILARGHACTHMCLNIFSQEHASEGVWHAYIHTYGSMYTHMRTQAAFFWVSWLRHLAHTITHTFIHTCVNTSYYHTYIHSYMCEYIILLYIHTFTHV